MECIWNTTEFHLHNTAVSLGKFDGFHLGHRLLIEYVTSLKEKGLTAVTFSFSVHPNQMLKPEGVQLIDTDEEKMKKAEKLGSDYLISYPFNDHVMNMEPEEFVKTVLVEKLDAKVVVVGKDYRFGKKRSGNVEVLEQLGQKYGFEVVSFEKVILGGEEVSSTRIRKVLNEGNMEEAMELLGEPFSITGEVVYGNQIGRTLGMPTANLRPGKQKLLPPNGVYASKIHIGDDCYFGITNIGYKPTVGGEKEKGVETFIFDFQGNLYGKTITVDLYGYERGEKKFSSLDELKKQMEMDCAYGKDYFKSNPAL